MLYPTVVLADHLCLETPVPYELRTRCGAHGAPACFGTVGNNCDAFLCGGGCLYAQTFDVITVDINCFFHREDLHVMDHRHLPSSIHVPMVTHHVSSAAHGDFLKVQN